MQKVGWLRRLFGDRGEREAASFLKKNGYKIIARQSFSKIGEIDLIATYQDTIVFIEVKTRSSNVTGHPAEAVNYRKQKQITRAALVWLKHRNLLEHRCRFDVIAITWTGERPVIEHFQNAFEATGRNELY